MCILRKRTCFAEEMDRKSIHWVPSVHLVCIIQCLNTSKGRSIVLHVWNVYMGVSKKLWYPQIIHFNRVGTTINHPFWGTPFLETSTYIYLKDGPNRGRFFLLHAGENIWEIIYIIKLLKKSMRPRICLRETNP